jgi:dolichol-phosphate mannosyltransferase
MARGDAGGATIDMRTLVFIPTYNERENVETMHQQIRALGLDVDILFVDDNSPDGTGQLLEEIARRDMRLHVVHRSGKLGIGSAHIDGIAWSYDHEFDVLITMDSDFSHSPSDIVRLLANRHEAEIVVGSRYLRPGSLEGWNLLRRLLTTLGHALTHGLLNMNEDATGALRLYDLRAIPRPLWEKVRSRGYSFFFESLFVLKANGFSIAEIPIVLPARTYGSSKMSLREAARSARRVVSLAFRNAVNPAQFRLQTPVRRPPDRETD